MSLPQSSVCVLPNEIITMVAEFLPRDPHDEPLLCFARASRTFSHIARGIFQRKTEICVPYRKVHALLRTALASPNWATEIKSLEITKFPAKPRSYSSVDKEWSVKALELFQAGNDYELLRRAFRSPSSFFEIQCNAALRQQCQEKVRNSTLNQQSRQKLGGALLEGHDAAFLALLLLEMPNLRALYFGQSDKVHFPMLYGAADRLTFILSRQSFLRAREEKQVAKHSYLVEIFQSIAPRLEILETPYVLSNQNYGPFHYRTFTQFSALQVLIVSLSTVRLSVSVVAMFPQSLRHLIIMDGRPYGSVCGLVWNLIDGRRNNPAWKHRNLLKIEVYFIAIGKDPLEQQILGMARSLGVSVLFWHTEAALDRDGLAEQRKVMRSRANHSIHI